MLGWRVTLSGTALDAWGQRYTIVLKRPNITVRICVLFQHKKNLLCTFSNIFSTFAHVMKHKIYVASSWRNGYYPEVVTKLREAGHDVYDFRNPPSGDPGFKWSSVSEDYMEWSPGQYRDMLKHPKAERQFNNDIEAMEACDTCVLVLPCGRSAHTEAGWFAGRGKLTIAYIPERQEPELMYKLFDKVCCSIDELIEALK